MPDSLKLTSEERRRILEGDSTALKRHELPDVEPGQTLLLLEQKARRESVFVDRFPGDRDGKFSKTVEVAAKPLAWIELTKVTERLGREYRYHIHFKLCDHREKVRRLGHPTASEKLDDETARGYGGPPIDELEAVDDDELRRQKVRSEERWAEHREEVASDEERRKQERMVRNQLRDRMKGLRPQAQAILLARIKQAIESDDLEEAA